MFFFFVFSIISAFLHLQIRNNEWHKCYLAHCLNEKRDKIREEAEFNELYRGTGCVLLANKKQPYNKTVR